jgi:hypothetical protein
MPASMALAMPPSFSTSSMMRAGLVGEFVREAFDVVAAAPRIDDAANPGLLPGGRAGCCARCGRRSRSAARWPRRARWCAATGCGPVVAAIASTQVRATLLNGSCSVSDQPEVCECVRSASDFGFFGLNCLDHLGPEQAAARILATSMKKFLPMAQKNESRGANASMSMPALTPGLQIFEAVGQRVGQLEVGRRAGFLHVVAGDRDRVELRHLLRGVGEDVGDDLHRGRGRIDVGVPHHELLEDVVLDRAGASSSFAPCSSAATM